MKYMSTINGHKSLWSRL